MGKSAAFDAIDFLKRPWVPDSGWPIAGDTLQDYLDRAAAVLNLGPNVYDERLWDLIGSSHPMPGLASDDLRSFFWQFARSRLDQFDSMRFGQEFAALKANNIRVLLNATVTRIGLTQDGNCFDHVEMSTVRGVKHRAKARSVVIAASAVENARLLLASNNIHAGGIGNHQDLVGRFLMDHVVARVGSFKPSDIPIVARQFGLYGIRYGGRTHMYMHGLALTPDVQERENLLNCAVYFMPDRSPDNPWDALKRLMRRKTPHPIKDAYSVISGAALIAKGIGVKALSSRGSVPHKLAAVSIDVISEQRPDRDSRITLSERTDALGVPLARVDWRINDDERRTVVRAARMTGAAFARANLPEPILEPWILHETLQNGDLIDFAHTCGTTRMSSDPQSGVVDPNCRVHGVFGLYVAGGSVFPTSGHANPTLMILALAIRLSDTIKSQLARAG